MKYFILNILFIALWGCHSKENSSDTIPTKAVMTDSLQSSANNSNTFNGLWQQYKKEGAKPNDTIPNLKCFVRINADTFYYIIDKKNQYIDLLVRDSSYKYPVYSFKNHYQDKLHVLTKDFKEIQLKKYANEGDYEYFIKVETK